MICSNCGANIPDGSAFCTNCGAAVAQAAPAPVQNGQPVYTQPPVQNGQPVYAQPPVYSQPAFSPKVLVWGILGLAFACTFYFSFLGIIFSAIGLKNATAFALANGSVFGQAKVGRILAKVGLIVGIILTAIATFVVFAAIVSN